MPIDRKRRLLILGGMVCLGVLAVGGYLYAQSLGNRQSFRSAPVTRGPLTAAVTATGTLNAVITVQVGSQVSGQIKEMFVDFNSIVKKGQVIARINPALFEAQVTDGQSSEMVGEALTEGQRVIIGTGNAEQAGSPSGSPRLRL
jgi:HlyD family secretion protein